MSSPVWQARNISMCSGKINDTMQHTGGYVTFSPDCADDWEGLVTVKVFDCTL